MPIIISKIVNKIKMIKKNVCKPTNLGEEFSKNWSFEPDIGILFFTVL